MTACDNGKVSGHVDMELDYMRQTTRGQATEVTSDARKGLTRRQSADRISLALRDGQTGRGGRTKSDHVVVPDTDATTMLLIPTRLVRHRVTSRVQNSSARPSLPHALGSTRNSTAPVSGWTHALGSTRNSTAPVSGWTHAKDVNAVAGNVNTSLKRTQLAAIDTAVPSVDAMPTFRGGNGYYGKKHYGNVVELLDLSLPMPKFKNQLSKRKQPQYIDIVRPMTSADVYSDRGDRNRNHRPQTAQTIDSQYSSRYPRRRVLSKTPHCSPLGSQEDLRNALSPLRSKSGLLTGPGNIRHNDVTSGKKNRTRTPESGTDWAAGRVGRAVNTCPSNKDGIDRRDSAGVNRTKYTLTVYVPCATAEGTTHGT